MKTGEIYTYALDNPKAEFKTVNYHLGDYVAHFNEAGKLIDELGNLVFPSCRTDWELIPQEVTWQEGIQAYLNKKGIRIECDGEVFSQSSHCKLEAFSNTSHKGLDEKLFRKGKWFIL